MERRAVSAGMLGSSSATSDACNSSHFLHDSSIITQLVVYPTCALSLLAVTFLWIRTSRRKPGIRAALSWWNYGGAILLAITFYALGILDTTLTDCTVTNLKESVILFIAAQVVLQLAALVLLAVLLLPFTLYLLTRAGQNTRFVRIANTAVLAIVALLLPPYLVIGSLFSLSPWIHNIRIPDFHVILDISTAYTCLFLFASVFGSAFLLFALIKAVGDVALSSSVKLWTLFTLSSFVLSNVVLVIDVFGWELPQRSLPKAGSIIITTLGNGFFTATFAGLLMAVSQSEVPPYDPTDDATYDPDNDEFEVQPKRFTYTGTTEIEPQPHHRLSRSRYSFPLEDSVSKQPQVYQTASGGYRGS